MDRPQREHLQPSPKRAGLFTCSCADVRHIHNDARAGDDCIIIEMSSSSDKILSFIERFEFIAEYFITYKYPTDTAVFHQFLVLVEAVKFYYRMRRLSTANIFIQEEVQAELKQPPKLTMPKEIKGTRNDMERLLEEIKTKAYEGYHHSVGMTETTSTGKKISLRSNLPLPPQFSLQRITSFETLGELIHLLRPLVYIIALWVYGPRSYKSWVISLVLDLVRIVLQRNMKVRDINEKSELDSRNRIMIMKMLFRNPFYESIFKPKIVLPLLARFFKTDGWITKIIMSLMEMRASVSLTI